MYGADPIRILLIAYHQGLGTLWGRFKSVYDGKMKHGYSEF